MAEIRKKICCFGEALLRFSPAPAKFITEAVMPVYIGGAELNAATALAKWDIPVKYVTALPDNYLAADIITDISGKGIDISGVRICGERTGAYYLSQGKDLKNNAVIYDRAGSSFSGLKPGDIDWDRVLSDVSWFHFSAISPALSAQAASVCKEALEAAAAKGIIISVDLNYRAKLWQYGEEPAAVMTPLLKYCNVIMGNVWAAEKLAGIGLSKNFDPVSNTNEGYGLEAVASAKKMMEAFPNCTAVANTFRFDEGESIRYFAALQTKRAQFVSAEFKVKEIVDRIGSGDCFMAGLIYGLHNEHDPQTVIEYSAAAAVAKLSQAGDATTSSISHIKTIMQHG